MQIIVPEYYKNFKCIAESCLHSCCIGWEIDIDSDTYELYKNLKGDMGEKIRANISVDGTPHFILDKNERCPFLKSNGLCDIILAFGDDGLCQICYDHPRFKNEFSFGTEMGLGLCCEAAAELILSDDYSFWTTVLLDDGGGEKLTQQEMEFLIMRDELFGIFADYNSSFSERIKRAAEKIGISPPGTDPVFIAGLYRSLERLDTRWDKYLDLLEGYNGDLTVFGDISVAVGRLLIYFTYRHLTDGLNDGNIKGRLAFILQSAVFCVLTCKAVYKDEISLKNFADICRMYSSEVEYSEENTTKLIEIFSV